VLSGRSWVFSLSEHGGAGVPRAGRVGLPLYAPLIVRDELFSQPAGVVVRVLLRWRLHEVGARPLERAREAMLQRQLAAANGIYHDAGRVGGVVHLQLQLDVERHVAEAAALQPDLRPLAVSQPGHVVGWADMDVIRTDLVIQL